MSKIRKGLALGLVSTMILACASPAFASGEAAVAQIPLDARAKEIIEVDGLQFKDLNANGELDAYEDWRLDTEDRITDLLDNQLTLEEKVGILFHCMTAGQFSPTYPMDDQFIYEQDCPFEANVLNGRYPDGYSIWYYVNVYNINSFLDDATGTPREIAEYHNKAQEVAEGSRLGIPLTFSCNREYNSWGSYVDKPQTAFGTTYDRELSAELWARYTLENLAVGYQFTMGAMGMELTSYFGEDPNYVAEMSALETSTIEGLGYGDCVKHFIARGNPGLSFGAARSVAQMVDNWMVPWKATIEANPSWLMTNTGSGLSNTVRVDYDKETMDYLRNVLGYDGAILTDWGPVGRGSMSGITADGIDLSTLSCGELYVMMLENGVDQFGAVSVQPGLDTSSPRDISNWPDTLIEEINNGKCDIALIDRAARRILRTKFNQGLFENPYVDVDAAEALCCSQEYLDAPWEITNNKDLERARNQEVVALEHRLAAESAVLLKNDDNILPLKAGVKAYITGDNVIACDLGKEAFAECGGIVADTIDEAEVIIIRCSTLATEDRWGNPIETTAALIASIDEAVSSGKPIVFIFDTMEPTADLVESSAAVLYLTYKTTPSHGASLPNMLQVTAPWVLSDILFGISEPTGALVKEIARSSEQYAEQWNDLANDTGASIKDRLLMMEMVRLNPTVDLPDNWGDPLYTIRFGMEYGNEPAFVYDTLVVPSTVGAGESFTAATVIRNDGDAATTTAQLTIDGEVSDEIFMAVNDGQFRVIEFTASIAEPGTHTIGIGTLESKITVQ